MIKTYKRIKMEKIIKSNKKEEKKGTKETAWTGKEGDSEGYKRVIEERESFRENL